MLGDTNILLRIGDEDAPEHAVVVAAVRKLQARGVKLCCGTQDMAEFWNVCTRPCDRGGMDLSVAETARRIHDLERLVTVFIEKAEQYRIWKALVEEYAVRGVQVHDARLVALMKSYSMSQILTLNGADFKRYNGIMIVHPSGV